MRTPLGLVRMCTLPQGGTNSVAYMVNAINKVLRDCIPNITMPFLDDIPIKGCPVEDKDETVKPEGCRKFVADHIGDCEKVLQRLERVHLTFSEEKSAFGQSEIMVVGHVRAIWPETVSGPGRNHLRDEGGRQVGHGSPEVLGSMRVLPHLDPALRPRRRATLRVVEERAQVRVDQGAYGVGPENERSA